MKKFKYDMMKVNNQGGVAIKKTVLNEMGLETGDMVIQIRVPGSNALLLIPHDMQKNFAEMVEPVFAKIAELHQPEPEVAAITGDSMSEDDAQDIGSAPYVIPED